jgi:hypothetical protein
MSNRGQELRIEACHARKYPCIGAVILSVALVDLAQLTRIGNDHLVPGSAREAAYPRRARSSFQYDATGRPAREMLTQRLRCRADSSFGDDFADFIKDAELAVAITDVKANRRTAG